MELDNQSFLSHFKLHPRVKNLRTKMSLKRSSFGAGPNFLRRTTSLNIFPTREDNNPKTSRSADDEIQVVPGPPLTKKHISESDLSRIVRKEKSTKGRFFKFGSLKLKKFRLRKCETSGENNSFFRTRLRFSLPTRSTYHDHLKHFHEIQEKTGETVVPIFEEASDSSSAENASVATFKIKIKKIKKTFQRSMSVLKREKVTEL